MPCSLLKPGDDRLSVDLRRTRDGRMALLVYSALDRLVKCCGDQQPWTVMPATDLEAIRLDTQYEIVFLDLEIPDEFRRRSGEE
ncbi:SAV_915 family protein [Micromonospora sp. DT201]|uniref:SAV_915 family protein n=1 Tax=Micromonospora sp. DT201 TaxID=3393442 RepID=UPI003CEDFA68